MKPLFKPRTVKHVILALFVLLLVKLIWFAVELVWLPSDGVDRMHDYRAKPLYYRIQTASSGVVRHKPVHKPKAIESDIRDARLLAVYAAVDIIVITVEYKGKSKVLGRGESINGYTLEDAGDDYAVFLKDGRFYRLKLHKSKQSFRATPSPVLQGDLVDRSVIDYYTAHMDDIYKNIGIRDMKKGDTLMGFQVTFVRRNSPFAKLGLRRVKIALMLCVVWSTVIHADEERVNINFRDLSVKDFIEMVSKITHKNILIDADLSGKIDFVSQEPIKKSSLLPLANAILGSKGLTIIDQGDFYKVVKSMNASGEGLDVSESIEREQCACGYCNTTYAAVDF